MLSTEIYRICLIPQQLLVYLKRDPIMQELFANTHEQCYGNMMTKILYQIFDDYRQSDELDRCGMSFQGTIGCIAIYDQQSNGLLQADMFYATNGKDCGASPRSLRSE